MVSNFAFNFNLRRYTAGVSVMLGFDCEATHAAWGGLKTSTSPRLSTTNTNRVRASV